MPRTDPWRPWTVERAGRAWYHCDAAHFPRLAAEWAEDGISVDDAEAAMEQMFARDMNVIAERSTSESPDAE